MIRLVEHPLKLTKNIAFILAAVFTFFGAVSWVAAQKAILFVAPVVVWAFAICAILAGLVATAVFVIERSAWLATRRAELHRDRTLANNEATKSDIEIKQANIQTRRMVDQERAEARLMAATVRMVERGKIHPSALGDGKFKSFPQQIIKQVENGAVPLLEAATTERRQDLLPAIADCPNILIVGGKGRGKTSLLQWLEFERLQAGNVVTVLDSHSEPGQWGGQVVGAGRKYESIAAAMLDLNTMLDNRYEQRAKGKNGFSTIDTFIDEFTLLPGKLKDLGFDIQKYSKPALTEGRKVGMNCIWGSHSDRAKALGLEGATDLKECFDAIVYLKKVKSDYYALIDFGEGIEDAKYNHPGPFTIDRPASKVRILSLPAPATPATNEPESISVSNWPKPQDDRPTADEMAIIEAVKQVELDHGKIIWSQVTTRLGWTATGPNNQRIKAVLDKWEISY